MRLWGTCLFVAGILMLLPLQSAVTACDCDFTATISLDDNLASELANETFLYTELNLSDRESIKNILENSEKIQSILEYFGINEDGLMFNDSLVIMINETDRYIMIPLNLTTGNQWNVTVNVTNEETNETTPMTFIGDFAAVNAYISGGEVINANWLEIEKIAGGLLYTLSNGNKTIDVATSDELGIGVTSGGITVSGVMWDTQNGNSTNESATPPPQPTGDWRCVAGCLANITWAFLGTVAGIAISHPYATVASIFFTLGCIWSKSWVTRPLMTKLVTKLSSYLLIFGAGVSLGYCLKECNFSASSISADIYIAPNTATVGIEYNQNNSLTAIINSDGSVDILDEEN